MRSFLLSREINKKGLTTKSICINHLLTGSFVGQLTILGLNPAAMPVNTVPPATGPDFVQTVPISTGARLTGRLTSQFNPGMFSLQSCIQV
jgi:hypothetical protein